MIDKRVRSLADAVAGIPDGATILCAGFGGAGLPDALCEAVIEQGARDLTVVANNTGTGRSGLAALLAAGPAPPLLSSVPRRPGPAVFRANPAPRPVRPQLLPPRIRSHRRRRAPA